MRDTDPSTTPPSGADLLPDVGSEPPRRTDTSAASLPEIRPLNESTDLDGLKRCVVELQDAERALLPSMPTGADIRDAYTDLLATNHPDRCTSTVIGTAYRPDHEWDDSVAGQCSLSVA